VVLVVGLHELLVHVLGQELIDPWALARRVHTHGLVGVVLSQVSLHAGPACLQVAVLAFYALAVRLVVGIAANEANF
jgi:hypothetical protein